MAGAEIDYSKTGLSLQFAIMDALDEARRVGAELPLPPQIRWGQRIVQTGDIWKTDVPTVGNIEIVTLSRLAGLQIGIVIEIPEGNLEIDGERARPETVLWPAGQGQTLAINYLSPGRQIRVTVVGEVHTPRGVKFERWTGNAGFWIERASSNRRIYHCNSNETTPLRFEDLVFSMEVSG